MAETVNIEMEQVESRGVHCEVSENIEGIEDAKLNVHVLYPNQAQILMVNSQKRAFMIRSKLKEVEVVYSYTNNLGRILFSSKITVDMTAPTEFDLQQMTEGLTTEKTAAEDACKLEHDISSESFDKLKKHIKEKHVAAENV